MGLRSLRALTLVFLLVFLATTIATVLGLLAVTHSTIAQLVDQRITAESDILAPQQSKLDRAELIARIDLLTRDRNTGDLGIVLTDPRGRQVAGNVQIGRPLPLGYSDLGQHDRIEGLTHGRALVRDIGGGLRLTVAAETEPVDHYDAARVRIYLAGFGSIILVVVGSTLLFTRSIRRRIVDMRATAEAIIDGDLRSRVPVDGSGSTFDRQAATFNRMLDRIGALMDQIANVTNDIAHEMRTPLSRFHQRLGLLASHAQAGPLRAELNEALNDANHLLGMFTAMLRIAEVEGGARRAGFAAVDLSALCAGIVTMLDAVAAESGHRLRVRAEEDIVMPGDRQLLSQMIINLIENSLRHTPHGSYIDVALHREGGEAILQVTDNGPGIDARDRKKALARFHRLDPGREQDGHGLGLPLVHAIVRLHRGDIALEDAEPGLRVVVRLPLD